MILSYLQLYLYFIHWMHFQYLTACRYGDIWLPLFPVDILSVLQYLFCLIWDSHNCLEHSDIQYFSYVYPRLWGFITKTTLGLSLVWKFVMLMWESENSKLTAYAMYAALCSVDQANLLVSVVLNIFICRYLGMKTFSVLV